MIMEKEWHCFVHGTKRAELARGFDIPRTTLTATLKDKDKIISNIFLSEYARKHDTVNGNPNQWTIEPLVSFGIEPNNCFRNTLL